MRKTLIFGIAGQDASYLTEFLLEKEYFKYLEKENIRMHFTFIR